MELAGDNRWALPTANNLHNNILAQWAWEDRSTQDDIKPWHLVQWLGHKAGVIPNRACNLLGPYACCCERDMYFSHMAQSAHNSVGEVRSGPVPGQFCRTGDRTVRSLTKILGPGLGPGPSQTVYIGLVPVQTWSLHLLFIYLFNIEDGGLMWDGTAPTCSAYRGLGGGDTGEAVDRGRPNRRTSVSFPSMKRDAGSHRAGIQSGWDTAVWPHAQGQ